MIARAEELRRERRQHNVTSLNQGRLFLVKTEEEVRAKPVDISSSGMGCTVSVKLQVGDSVVLELPDRSIRFVVRNCVKAMSQPGSYRAGFELVEDSVDLLKVFGT